MTPGPSPAPPRCAARQPAPRWGCRCNPSPAAHIIHCHTSRSSNYSKIIRVQNSGFQCIPVCEFVTFKMFFSLCESHDLGASLPCVSGLLRPVGHVYCQGRRRSLHRYNGAGQPARTVPFEENLKSSHAVVNCWNLAIHGTPQNMNDAAMFCIRWYSGFGHDLQHRMTLRWEIVFWACIIGLTNQPTRN